MTTENYTAAMIDPQLGNNSSSSNSSNNSNLSQHLNNGNNNNNNDTGQPKYLHKKFKKMATSEVISSTNALEFITSTSVTSGLLLAAKNCSNSLDFQIANTTDESELRKSSYTCPYCKLSCTKPSVLQKHIRAHTNERPYPCVPCGFAFKTKSNLYKHCRSRAHAIKIESPDIAKIASISSQLSEDSDISLSDSNDTGTPPPPVPPRPMASMSSVQLEVSNSYVNSSADSNVTFHPTLSTKVSKIYKPKFHTALRQSVTICDSISKSNTGQLQEHIERIITNNRTAVNTFDPGLHNFLNHQQSLTESTIGSGSRKRHHSDDSNNKYICSGASKLGSNRTDSEHDFLKDLMPLASPGPVLGKTRLVDSSNNNEILKHTHLEPTRQKICDELSKYSGANALQMFGGEVRICDKSGESKTMRIEPRIGGSQTGPLQSCDISSPTPTHCAASVVVRSGLHSGGTILHQSSTVGYAFSEHAKQIRQILPAASLEIANIAPYISAPSLAPNLTASISGLDYVRPASILHAGRLIPFVPGMPGPHNISYPLDLVTSQATVSIDKDESTLESAVQVEEKQLVSISSGCKFLRPSTLSLKPGTFTPKRYHGITPTVNTLSLISPETPRPKKSYGQLYLNGHAYTYLGLKCSTRVFYCTLNRPQPMYVTQQHGLSMYSNWKICQEALSELELSHYDSRHRLTGYTLASVRQEDILTHSSRRPSTPSSPDSGLESDSQEKSKRIRIFNGGFESNEDYIYVRGRGRGRYICEECGIRCKKPSMLKKHIRTHTDVRPYTCRYCTFSFKTKGNLTKHMKSKAHYKKCVELKVLPVPTSVCDENIDKEALDLLTVGDTVEDTSSSEEDEEEEESEADGDDSEESANEEHEAAQSLLRLSRPKIVWPPGLLPLTRPATYPYILSGSNLHESTPVPIISPSKSQSSNETSDETRLSVIRSCKKDEGTTNLVPSTNAPMDLTIRQSTELKHGPSSSDILAGVSGPTLLQTIVQTMERFPIPGRKWPNDSNTAEGLMLQAYLTERHVVDSKIKQQYRVANNSSTEELVLESNVTRSDQTSLTNLTNIVEKTNLALELPVQKNNSEHRIRPPNEISTTSIQFRSRIEFNKRQEELKLKQQLVKHLDSKMNNEAISNNLKMSYSVMQHHHQPQQQQQTAQKVVVLGGTGFRSTSPYNIRSSKTGLEFFQPSNANTSSYVSITEDSRNVCSICNKVFSKPSQLRLHINIHYFERPFRCESCGTSFRTKGHLTKHERSTLHQNKVNMTSTFGAATASNPRPFKCIDCKSAFRIHGHLAKHLRSKMHIMKLECLHKLPFGTYAEMERSGLNLNDIDTTDCDTSLTSLQIMAQKLFEKDSSKLEQWEVGIISKHANSSGETSSDEGEANSAQSISHCIEVDSLSQNDYAIKTCNKSNDKNLMNISVDKMKNSSIYNCQLCPLSLKNLNELRMHCYLEHNIESADISGIHSSINVEIQSKEKENTHCFKRIEKCLIKNDEAGHKINTT